MVQTHGTRKVGPVAQNKIRGMLKAAILGCVMGLFFMAGVGVGNGRIQFGAVLPSQNKSLPERLDFSSLEHTYDLLKTNYDGKLDVSKLLDGAKNGLTAAAGDPYTQYLSKDEAKRFNEELNGSFTGIGAQLGQDEDGNLIVVAPIDNSPASKAGLRSQDIIMNIDGTTTTGMNIDTAVNRIRGPKNTTVALDILRGKTETIKLTITRDDIKIPSVTWELIDGQIGYIDVSQFGSDTVMLMNQAATELKQKGATRILLDVRGNPGGLLNAASDMAGLWLPKGATIVQEKRGGIVTDTRVSKGGGVFQGLPTVVLIDAGSASASEIVAGALRDNNAATLIGEKTYGKGSVQQLQRLSDGSEIKITIARWYRPNGQNIDKKGIQPDSEVKRTEEDYVSQRDPQKDAAIDYLKNH